MVEENSKKAKTFSEIDKKIEESKKDIEVLPTGFDMIDKFLDGGFLRKELVVIGAGTGKGKSTCGGEIFKNIAMQGFKSAYFSLEISNEMVASRLIGSTANISPTRVMIKVLSDEEQESKNEAKAELAVYEEFMYFYDSLYLLPEIEKEIRANNYDFVVIDFIQNIVVQRPDEYERLSHVAMSLQKLAKEKNCCILALSQLSNQMTRERREDIVEYKGSGTIGTVCDLGFFIEQGTMGDNSFTLRLRKNRRGTSGIAFNFLVKTPGFKIISQ